jgi:predicted lipoprotein with Yx(FWY)xxD motif
MKFSRYTFSMIIVLLVALIAAACGGTSSPSSSSTPSSAPGTTPTTAGAPTTAPATPEVTPTQPSSVPKVAVRVGTATVSGKSEKVLANTAGKTLYYLTSDTATHVACTGQCITFWPPLTTSGLPTSSDPLPHKLSARADANGRQVEYGGHLLYTFSGDLSAGQAHGEGITSFGGTWHVATPGL